jgi:plastocyanin
METETETVNGLYQGAVVLLDGEPHIVTTYDKSPGGKSGTAKVTLEFDGTDERRVEPVDAEVTVPDVDVERNPTITVGGEEEFDPSVVRIPLESPVVWFWSDPDAAHEVIDEGGRFESDEVQGVGYTFEWTYETPGSYPFRCRSHGHRGIVTVEEPDEE